MSKYLHREDAPFGDALWTRIDQAVVETAKAHMAARRLLHLDGPHGLGLKDVPGDDEAIETSEGLTVLASKTVPVAQIAANFVLSQRDLAAWEERDAILNLAPVARAAAACARQEDQILFHGSKALGTPGLLAAKGAASAKLGDWSSVGAAAEDIIAAATALDQAGFRGPYALALAPGLYNQLFRLYPQGSMTELDHINKIATDGVVKAPALQSGGVMIASGRQYASIIVGQDLAAGFLGPTEQSYEFFLSESVALRLVCPEAITVLK